MTALSLEEQLRAAGVVPVGVATLRALAAPFPVTGSGRSG